MLLERGYEVRIFDKLYFGEKSLEPVRSAVDLIPGDVRDFDPSILEDIVGVIHLGSLSNDPTSAFYPEANKSINFEGTIRLAEACQKKGVTRFTHASTCAVYGFHPSGIADESYPDNPQSDYARSKLNADLRLREMAGPTFCPVILRQATVYGFSPRMRWDTVVNAFIMHAFKTGILDVWFGGHAWRPVVHVRDVAEAHIRCLEADSELVNGETFNLVFGNYQVIELAERVQKVLKELKINTGIEINCNEEDTRSYRTDGSKIARTLGFTPSISVEEGVREITKVLMTGQYRDFDHPIYYNLSWIKLLLEVEERLKKTGQIL